MVTTFVLIGTYILHRTYKDMYGHKVPLDI